MRDFRRVLNCGLTAALLILSLPLTAQDGSAASLLDLRGVDFASQGSVALDGDWDFYWHEFLTPGTQPSRPGYKVPVPGNWNDSDAADGDVTIRGWGSYRLTLLLPPTNDRLALYIPYLTTNYRIFSGNELLAENAQPRKAQHNMDPPVRSQVVLLPQAEELVLTVQVSNFHDNIAGITHSFKAGTLESISSGRENTALYDVMLFGALFLIGVYHLNFFILRRKDQAALFFGLFSMLIGLRSLFYGEQIILIVFPDMPPELFMALGHLTQSLSIPLFLHFFNCLFPTSFSRYYLPFFDLVSVLYSLAAIFLPHHIYIHLLLPYNIITLVMGVYVLTILVTAIMTGTRHAAVFLAGFLILLGTTVNDILLSYQVIHTTHLAPFGQLAFIVSQALILSFNITDAFNRAEALTVTLTRINRAFRRFVPKEFLGFLKIEDITEVTLGDHVEESMTVMFADIRSFTNLSEELTPEENFQFINSYLSRMGPIIRNHEGFIDKYIGDAIMALFPRGPDSALDAAVGMQQELVRYNRDRASIGYKPIAVGIGIHTGNLMLGTVGESERMESTVISDSVNLCARIEKLTKTFGIRIALSEASFHQLEQREHRNIRFIGKVTVKGKNQPVAIFDCFDGDPAMELKCKQESQAVFEEGVGLYYMRRIDEAEACFRAASEAVSEDKAPQFYLKRMREHVPISGELPKDDDQDMLDELINQRHTE